MKKHPQRSLAARLVLTLLPLVGLVGCGLIEARPTARVTGVKLKDIDLTAVTMLFDVEVDNPYAVPLPLVNVDYSLASGDKPFLSGEAELQGTVPAKDKKTISLPAKVTYKQLLGALAGVKPGSVVPYRAGLGLSVDAPLLGRLRVPMEKEGELPVPAPPEVSVQQITWDKLSPTSAGGTIRLNVVNRNQFPVDLSQLAYGLTLGKTEVAKATLAKPLKLAADGGAGVLEVPISLSPSKLGFAVLGMLTGDGANYKLAGDASVGTPFGPMKLPIEKAGKTVFRK